jgi:hypothetical protein
MMNDQNQEHAEPPTFAVQTLEVLAQYRALWPERPQADLLQEALWLGEIEDFTGFDPGLVANYVGDNIRYYCDSNEAQWLAIQTVARLPREVREFVFERCVFLSIGHVNHGMALPGTIAQPDTWIILLGERLPQKDAHSIVAHEIAHAWLGHNRFALDVPPDCETQAANLTRDWGFTGKGANARYCNGYLRSRKQ